ncbi:MAG: hypothetical protein O2968_23390, partial [Acidobacteria bacterium]|nr:hypothetical protein [Acidobacteriota bacterium]
MHWLRSRLAPTALTLLLSLGTANSENFVMPFSGILYLEALGGEAAASSLWQNTLFSGGEKQRGGQRRA